MIETSSSWSTSSLLSKFEKCILLLFTLSLWTNISPYYNYSASDIFVWLYTIITGPYSSSFIFRRIPIPEKLSSVVTQLFCGGKSVAWRHEQRIRRNHEKGQRKTWRELWELFREWNRPPWSNSARLGLKKTARIGLFRSWNIDRFHVTSSLSNICSTRDFESSNLEVSALGKKLM